MKAWQVWLGIGCAAAIAVVAMSSNPEALAFNAVVAGLIVAGLAGITSSKLSLSLRIFLALLAVGGLGLWAISKYLQSVP